MICSLKAQVFWMLGNAASSAGVLLPSGRMVLQSLASDYTYETFS
jgi:hypothetical protein